MIPRKTSLNHYLSPVIKQSQRALDNLQLKTMVLNPEQSQVPNKLLTNMWPHILRAYLETRKLKALFKMRSKLTNKTRSTSKRSRRKISKSELMLKLISLTKKRMVRNIPQLRTMKMVKMILPYQNGQNTTILLNKNQKSKKNQLKFLKQLTTGRNSTKMLKKQKMTKTSSKD